MIVSIRIWSRVFQESVNNLEIDMSFSVNAYKVALDYLVLTFKIMHRKYALISKFHHSTFKRLGTSITRDNTFAIIAVREEKG